MELEKEKSLVEAYESLWQIAESLTKEGHVQTGDEVFEVMFSIGVVLGYHNK